MARIVGSICTSHIAAIGNAIARGLQTDSYRRPFHRGYPPVCEWIERVKPDVAVIVYHDHGLNFCLETMPTFAVGEATEYQNADECGDLPTLPAYPGDPALSRHIIESLMSEEFDLTSCRNMKVDHAVTVPIGLLWPDTRRRVRTIPVAVNVAQCPLPTPSRCLKLGQAIGRAIAAYPEDLRVVMLGTGGLSHQISGEGVGFAYETLDRECLEKIIDNPEALAKYSTHDLAHLAGAQGTELMMWLAMRGALSTRVRQVYRRYHVPLSNAAEVVLLLENEA